MRIIGIVVFVVMVGNIAYSQTSTKATTDTTIAVPVVLETLVKQYNEMVEQKKQLEEQMLRIEGQIVLLRAMTSDSLKVKKGE